MKKYAKYLLILSILLYPNIVLAKTTEITIGGALVAEALLTLPMSAVLTAISYIFSEKHHKKVFWALFIIRVLVLLYFDFFVTPYTVIVDFLLIMIGIVAIVIPKENNGNKKSWEKAVENIEENTQATNINTNTNENINANINANTNANINTAVLKCSKCNSVLESSNKFCPKCGSPVNQNQNLSVQLTPPKVVVMPKNFDKMYSLSEEEMLDEFINRELTKAGIDKSTKLIPGAALKRKKNLNILFSTIVFIYITLIFFHFPIYTYIIGIIIILILYKFTGKYDLNKYLKKQLKARPKEKISNIVMQTKNTLAVDDTKNIFVVSLCLAIIVPLLIFSTPKIIYEKTPHGYYVRYYIFGLTNFTTVTIPETHNNESVVGLRGNTFSNMLFLKSVKLPDTITEIRGQAFKNCISLVDVNIPKQLEYLGGGAFYNAKSIEKIELPDTLTYLGGESFRGAKSLKSIKLSSNLTEIRGNSFEYCTSLESISIPNKVERIGGHAFYGASSLHTVSFTPRSRLSEIGSSAFRRCPNLYTVTLPSGVYINERAFKESPTAITRFKNNYNPNY